jgi:23S rRNA pseudouridine2605 synthase
VTSGRVRVNGRVVRELGTRADPRRDKIEVDGKALTAEDLAYVVLHKPRAVVSTLDDPEGRPTVAELVRDVPLRLYPVGRLDFHTSGVLLMTNDGELTQALLHPKGEVEKTYVVKLSGEIDEVEIDKWRHGMELDDGPTKPAEVALLRNEAGKSWLRVTLTEGRNQQIRRMAEASGFTVMRLARLAFAGISAEDLRPGKWRPLTVDELKALKQRYGVPKRIRSQTALTAGRSGRTGRSPRAAGRSASRARGRAGPAGSRGRS